MTARLLTLALLLSACSDRPRPIADGWQDRWCQPQCEWLHANVPEDTGDWWWSKD